jgi:HK97 gp10 family phage protein
VTFDLATTTDTADLDTIIRRLESLPAIVEKYADLIAEAAKRYAPVKTGALRDSIVAHLNGLTAEITAGEGLPDARAVYMEYGTAHIVPRYYFRPAVEQYALAFIIEVEKVMGGE